MGARETVLSIEPPLPIPPGVHSRESSSTDVETRASFALRPPNYNSTIYIVRSLFCVASFRVRLQYLVCVLLYCTLVSWVTARPPGLEDGGRGVEGKHKGGEERNRGQENRTGSQGQLVHVLLFVLRILLAYTSTVQ